ncbi:MAG: DUF4340 domain-containing protein [Ruminococcus sp.]|nr:DUF4340 domain-containing protein [Ruminococcus sp.]
MKKQVKGLIALGAATAVLGGGLILLKVTSPGKDSSSDISSTEETDTGSGLVLVEDSNDTPGSHTADESHTHGLVKDVKVKNEHGTMEVYMSNDADSIENAKYALKGFEDIRMIDSSVRMMTSSADNITSTAVIEKDCTDFEKFGLGDTAVTVEMSYASGRTKKLYIGTVAPVSGGTYARVEGCDTVFTVSTSSVEYYLKSPEDYIELIMLSTPSEDDYPKVDSIRIERKDIEYDIYLEYGKYSDISNSGGSSATHVMIEPVETYLKVEASADITNGMFGLTAESVKCHHCTDKDIADAGLSDPYCTVTMKCDNGKDYVLLMSEPYTEEGVKKSNVMFKDANIIFTVTCDKAKWATVMPEDIASQNVFASFVWNVGELEASANGLNEKFTISMKDSSKQTTDAKAEDVDVKRNGEGFDAERYRQFYAYMIQLDAESLVMDGTEPSGEPMAKVVVKDSFLKTENTFEFYDYSVMKCLVTVDGKSKYYCAKANVNGLIENMRKLSTGEPFEEIK